jgi:hypothetical protein
MQNYLNEMVENIRVDVITLAQMQQEAGHNAQFESFGDNFKPSNTSGPQISVSHRGSALGIQRPKEKIEGVIFKEELSQKNLLNPGEVRFFD